MADDVDLTEDLPAPAEAPPKAKTPPAPPDPDEMSEAELRESLRKVLRAKKESDKEAIAGREAKRKLQELQDERDRLEQEKLTDDEKRKARLSAAEVKARESEDRAARLERELSEMRIASAVEEEAKRRGFDNPKVAAVMVRGAGGYGIEIDPETGKVIGAKAAIDTLLKEYPELPVGGIRGGGGTPSREGSAYRVPARSAGTPRTAVEAERERAAVDTEALRSKNRYESL